MFSCDLELGKARLQRHLMAQFIYNSVMFNPTTSTHYRTAYMGRSASSMGVGPVGTNIWQLVHRKICATRIHAIWYVS